MFGNTPGPFNSVSLKQRVWNPLSGRSKETASLESPPNWQGSFHYVAAAVPCYLIVIPDQLKKKKKLSERMK